MIPRDVEQPIRTRYLFVGDVLILDLLLDSNYSRLCWESKILPRRNLILDVGDERVSYTIHTHYSLLVLLQSPQFLLALLPWNLTFIEKVIRMTWESHVLQLVNKFSLSSV